MAKKIIVKITATIAMLCCLIVPVNAQTETGTKIGVGYTQEGIYFEVYDAGSSETVLTSNDDGIYVTREIIYSGIVKPTSELSWMESINGESYSGTLYLRYISYYQDTEKTVAIYEGTLYKD